MTTRLHKNPSLWFALLALSTVSLSAQSTTPWAGYFTVNTNPGTGSSYGNSVISFPLQGTVPSTGATSVSGQMVGQVTAVGAHTITNSNAAWPVGTGTHTLSDPNNPVLLQFTSGAAAGRTFLVSTTTGVDATGTILTLDSTETTSLTSIPVAAGDTYQIVPADTLSNVFGTGNATGLAGDGKTGVLQGGTSNTGSGADIVQLLNQPGGSWLSYYYDLTRGGWFQTGKFGGNASNLVIRPDAGAIFQRLSSTSLSLMMVGQAPTVARQAVVSNIGNTFLSSYWPTSQMTLGTPTTGYTLGGSRIETIPGWVSGAQGTADSVVIFNGTSWLSYYNNGTAWFQTGKFAVPANTLTINPGTAMILVKQASSSGQSILSQPLPY